MKTKRFWLHFICHDTVHIWRWKPALLRSNIIYNSSNKMWIAPQIEFSWLFIVLQWTFYSRKQEYKAGYFENCSVEEALQDRVSALEKAISQHKNNTYYAIDKDIELWKILD